MDERILEIIQNEFAAIRDLLSDIMPILANLGLEPARVVKIATSPEEEDTFGIGAVQVEIINHGIPAVANVWAKPVRSGVGQFVIPPVDSHVLVMMDGELGRYRYLGHTFLEPFYFADNYAKPDGYTTAEKIGYIADTTSDQFGGKRLMDVRDNPETKGLVASRDWCVVGFDDTSKTLDISVADNSVLKLASGNAAKIEIVNEQDSGTANGKLVFEFDGSGNVTVTSDQQLILKGSEMRLDGQTSAVPLEKMVLGETLQTQLNTDMTAMQTLQAALAAWAPQPADGGAALKTALAGFLALAMADYSSVLSDNNKNN